MKSDQLQEFIRLRVIEGKSHESIASTLNLSQDIILEMEKKYSRELLLAKANEYDKILEYHALDTVNRFRYLAELYKRLQKELDKRDFTGLPTDKLYTTLNDVYNLMQSLKESTTK